MADPLLISILIFVIAIFTGYELITKVPPTLHTPLMSGSNAISGIIVIGALVVAGRGHSDLSIVLGVVAVALATINVVGGFLVTDRMLKMFRPRERPDSNKPDSGPPK
ncbi:MAG: NAD(P) transhydrogenase subunit alpha [Chloroflexi bacterium]|nr:NAD(P) transhydrogenase subunit alpha [Chloroflexota bacterium]